MKDLTLYTHPVSANSHRVKLLLSLLGVDHSETSIDLFKNEQRTAEFAAVSPWAQIPVLRDGDLVLNESYAILLYLAGEYGTDGGAQWWPETPGDQARVARWMFFTANMLHNGIGLARNEYGFGIPSGGQLAFQRGTKALHLLEAHLANRKWFELDRPTLADVSVYPFIAVAPEAGFDLSPYEHLSDWVARFSEQPGFIKMPRVLPDKAPQA